MRRISLIGLLLVTGCLPNPYAQFYQGLPDARQSPGYEASTSPVQLYSSNDVDRDVLELMRRGYNLIGTSSFNAGMNNVRESQLSSQATRVGAQVVLVSSRYTNTISGAIPLSLPTTSTTTSSATATAYGSGGVVTGYGTGTSTTYGTQTVMVPYSVARADFTALYFAHTKTRLGVYVAALDDSTRRRLQSNSGVKILVVVNDSPAFNADIIAGDILTQVNGEPVRSVEIFAQLLNENEGKTVALTLNRDGHQVRKTVAILRLDHP